ncbi:membrane-spanning 4-domains subfamily A member 4A-like isoform X3 [Leptodactylus fuscus]|uniref:membrane-spanning 4-domains subfamily A member 4A-like isoform X3 n=1 Tax=Leptodactylus fuscus TaxID=238119 RepID=UPI003F4EB384
MSCQVVPDAGDFAVIYQVNPQTEQRNGPEQESCHTPASLPKPIATFYSGEPELLGTTQIFTGILLLSFGLLMTIVFTATTYHFGLVIVTGVPLWSGILIKSSLAMNVVGAVTAGFGIILTAFEISLPIFTPNFLEWPYCAHYQRDVQCIGNFVIMPVYICFLSFILMLSTLMFCITISTSVFACRTVCRRSLQNMTVVIYQTTSLNVTNPSRDLPPDSAAAMSSDLKTQT